MKFLTRSLNANSTDRVRIDSVTYSIVDAKLDKADIPLYEVESDSGKRKSNARVMSFATGVVATILVLRLFGDRSTE